MPSISQYCTRPTITYLSNSSWLKNPVWLSRCLGCIYSLVCTIIRRETGQNTTSMSTAVTQTPNHRFRPHHHWRCTTRTKKPLCSKELNSSETRQKSEQNKETQEIVRQHKLTQSTNLPVILRDQQGFLGFFSSTQTIQLPCSLLYTWKICLLLQYSEPTVSTDNCTNLFSQYLPKFTVYPKALWSPPHLRHLCLPTARGMMLKAQGSIRWNAEGIKKVGNWLKSTTTD